MKLESAACFVAAVLFHALVLFGFRLETPARPLTMTEDQPAPMDVSLVEAAPEAAPPTPAPPQPAPTPEPAEPQPTPDIPTPAPTPQPETILPPESTPIPERPKPLQHHPEQGHPKPSTPHSATAPTGATIGPLSSRASYLSNPKPDYPEQARQARQQGVVEVNVVVGADGRVSEVTVSRTSGFPLLDNAALQAVRRWIFEPARAGGLPVPSRVDVPVRFSLAD